jgi:DNA-binding transcriptional LysR family regulator
MVREGLIASPWRRTDRQTVSHGSAGGIRSRRGRAAGSLGAGWAYCKRGTLAVQASQTIASYWLPRHLVAFRRAHPGIDIRRGVDTTAQVAAKVHEGTADVGFIEGAIDNPMLMTEQVALDQAWSGIQYLERARLLEVKWVLREPGSGTRSIFEAALQALGMSPSDCALRWTCRPTKQCGQPSGRDWAQTAISESVAAPGLGAGLLHEVRFAPCISCGQTCGAPPQQRRLCTPVIGHRAPSLNHLKV